jgi:hypothetical protein
MRHAAMEQQVNICMKKGIELSANVESELTIPTPKTGHTDNLHQDKANPDRKSADQEDFTGKKQTCFHFVSIIDQNVVGMRWVFITAVVVSLLTKKYDQGHIDHCWKNF